VLDRLKQFDNLSGTCDQLVVFPFLERVCEDFDLSPSVFADGIRVSPQFALFLALDEVGRSYTPKDFQISVYLVVFIGELDVVFNHVFPPGLRNI
jgi:hypothetical protein